MTNREYLATCSDMEIVEIIVQALNLYEQEMTGRKLKANDKARQIIYNWLSGEQGGGNGPKIHDESRTE